MMTAVAISEIDPTSDALVTHLIGVAHNWSRFAVCQDDRSLYFAAAGERPERRRRRETAAKRVCAACPVRIECRDAGREGREHGVWGGETEAERAALGYLPRRSGRRLTPVDE